MTYSIERSYNLEERLKDPRFKYENLKLAINDATTPKEAEIAISEWAEEIIVGLRSKLNNQTTYERDEQ